MGKCSSKERRGRKLVSEKGNKGSQASVSSSPSSSPTASQAQAAASTTPIQAAPPKRSEATKAVPTPTVSPAKLKTKKSRAQPVAIATKVDDPAEATTSQSLEEPDLFFAEEVQILTSSSAPTGLRRRNVTAKQETSSSDNLPSDVRSESFHDAIDDLPDFPVLDSSFDESEFRTPIGRLSTDSNVSSDKSSSFSDRDWALTSHYGFSPKTKESLATSKQVTKESARPRQQLDVVRSSTDEKSRDVQLETEKSSERAYQLNAFNATESQAPKQESIISPTGVVLPIQTREEHFAAPSMLFTSRDDLVVQTKPPPIAAGKSDPLLQETGTQEATHSADTSRDLDAESPTESFEHIQASDAYYSEDDVHPRKSDSSYVILGSEKSEQTAEDNSSSSSQEAVMIEQTQGFGKDTDNFQQSKEEQSKQSETFIITPSDDINEAQKISIEQYEQTEVPSTRSFLHPQKEKQVAYDVWQERPQTLKADPPKASIEVELIDDHEVQQSRAASMQESKVSDNDPAGALSSANNQKYDPQEPDVRDTEAGQDHDSHKEQSHEPIVDEEVNGENKPKVADNKEVRELDITDVGIHGGLLNTTVKAPKKETLEQGQPSYQLPGAEIKLVNKELPLNVVVVEPKQKAGDLEFPQVVDEGDFRILAEDQKTIDSNKEEYDALEEQMAELILLKPTALVHKADASTTGTLIDEQALINDNQLEDTQKADVTEDTVQMTVVKDVPIEEEKAHEEKAPEEPVQTLAQVKITCADEPADDFQALEVINIIKPQQAYKEESIEKVGKTLELEQMDSLKDQKVAEDGEERELNLAKTTLQGLVQSDQVQQPEDIPFEQEPKSYQLQNEESKVADEQELEVLDKAVKPAAQDALESPPVSEDTVEPCNDADYQEDFKHQVEVNCDLLDSSDKDPDLRQEDDVKEQEFTRTEGAPEVDTAQLIEEQASLDSKDANAQESEAASLEIESERNIPGDEPQLVDEQEDKYRKPLAVAREADAFDEKEEKLEQPKPGAVPDKIDEATTESLLQGKQLIESEKPCGGADVTDAATTESLALESQVPLDSKDANEKEPEAADGATSVEEQASRDSKQLCGMADTSDATITQSLLEEQASLHSKDANAQEPEAAIIELRRERSIPGDELQHVDELEGKHDKPLGVEDEADALDAKEDKHEQLKPCAVIDAATTESLIEEQPSIESETPCGVADVANAATTESLALESQVSLDSKDADEDEPDAATLEQECKSYEEDKHEQLKPCEMADEVDAATTVKEQASRDSKQPCGMADDDDATTTESLLEKQASLEDSKDATVQGPDAAILDLQSEGSIPGDELQDVNEQEGKNERPLALADETDALEAKEDKHEQLKPCDVPEIDAAPTDSLIEEQPSIASEKPSGVADVADPAATESLALESPIPEQESKSYEEDKHKQLKPCEVADEVDAATSVEEQASGDSKKPRGMADVADATTTDSLVEEQASLDSKDAAVQEPEAAILDLQSERSIPGNELQHVDERESKHEKPLEVADEADALHAKEDKHEQAKPCEELDEIDAATTESLFEEPPSILDLQSERCIPGDELQHVDEEEAHEKPIAVADEAGALNDQEDKQEQLKPCEVADGVDGTTSVEEQASTADDADAITTEPLLEEQESLDGNNANAQEPEAAILQLQSERSIPGEIAVADEADALDAKDDIHEQLRTSEVPDKVDAATTESLIEEEPTISDLLTDRSSPVVEIQHVDEQKGKDEKPLATADEADAFIGKEDTHEQPKPCEVQDKIDAATKESFNEEQTSIDCDKPPEVEVVADAATLESSALQSQGPVDSTDTNEQEPDVHQEEEKDEKTFNGADEADALDKQEDKHEDLKPCEVADEVDAGIAESLIEEQAPIHSKMPCEVADHFATVTTEPLLKDLESLESKDANVLEPEAAIVEEQQRSFQLQNEEGIPGDEEQHMEEPVIKHEKLVADKALDEQEDKHEELEPCEISDEVVAATTESLIDEQASIDSNEQCRVADVDDAETTEPSLEAKARQDGKDTIVQEPEATTSKQEQRSYQFQSEESTPADEPPPVNEQENKHEKLEPFAVANEADALNYQEDKYEQLKPCEVADEVDAAATEHFIEEQASMDIKEQCEVAGEASTETTELLLEEQASTDSKDANELEPENARLIKEQRSHQLQSEGSIPADEQPVDEQDNRNVKLMPPVVMDEAGALLQDDKDEKLKLIEVTDETDAATTESSIEEKASIDTKEPCQAEDENDAVTTESLLDKQASIDSRDASVQEPEAAILRKEQSELFIPGYERPASAVDEQEEGDEDSRIAADTPEETGGQSEAAFLDEHKIEFQEKLGIDVAPEPHRGVESDLATEDEKQPLIDPNDQKNYKLNPETDSACLKGIDIIPELEQEVGVQEQEVLDGKEVPDLDVTEMAMQEGVKEEVQIPQHEQEDSLKEQEVAGGNEVWELDETELAIQKGEQDEQLQIPEEMGKVQAPQIQNEENTPLDEEHAARGVDEQNKELKDPKLIIEADEADVPTTEATDVESCGAADNEVKPSIEDNEQKIYKLDREIAELKQEDSVKEQEVLDGNEIPELDVTEMAIQEAEKEEVRIPKLEREGSLKEEEVKDGNELQEVTDDNELDVTEMALQEVKEDEQVQIPKLEQEEAVKEQKVDGNDVPELDVKEMAIQEGLKEVQIPQLEQEATSKEQEVTDGNEVWQLDVTEMAMQEGVKEDEQAQKPKLEQEDVVKDQEVLDGSGVQIPDLEQEDGVKQQEVVDDKEVQELDETKMALQKGEHEKQLQIPNIEQEDSVQEGEELDSNEVPELDITEIAIHEGVKKEVQVPKLEHKDSLKEQEVTDGNDARELEMAIPKEVKEDERVQIPGLEQEDSVKEQEVLDGNKELELDVTEMAKQEGVNEEQVQLPELEQEGSVKQQGFQDGSEVPELDVTKMDIQKGEQDEQVQIPELEQEDSVKEQEVLDGNEELELDVTEMAKQDGVKEEQVQIPELEQESGVKQQEVLDGSEVRELVVTKMGIQKGEQDEQVQIPELKQEHSVKKQEVLDGNEVPELNVTAMAIQEGVTKVQIPEFQQEGSLKEQEIVDGHEVPVHEEIPEKHIQEGLQDDEAPETEKTTLKQETEKVEDSSSKTEETAEQCISANEQTDKKHELKTISSFLDGMKEIPELKPKDEVNRREIPENNEVRELDLAEMIVDEGILQDKLQEPQQTTNYQLQNEEGKPEDEEQLLKALEVQQQEHEELKPTVSLAEETCTDMPEPLDARTDDQQMLEKTGPPYIKGEQDDDAQQSQEVKPADEEQLERAADEDETHKQVTKSGPTPQDLDVLSEQAQNDEVQEQARTTPADAHQANSVEQQKEDHQELTSSVFDHDVSMATTTSLIEAEASSDELHELKPTVKDEADAPTIEEEASIEDMKQQDDAHLQEPEAVTVEQEQRSYQLESDETTATNEEQLVHAVDTPREPEEELQSEETHEEPLASAMDEQKEELQELKFTVEDDEADAARAEEKASIDDIKPQDDAHFQEPKAEQEPRSYQLPSEESTPDDEEQLSNAVDSPNEPKEELEELKPTVVEGEVDAATAELMGDVQASLQDTIQQGDIHPEDPEVTPVEQEQRSYQLQSEESRPDHEEQLAREATEKMELQDTLEVKQPESSPTPQDLDVPSEEAQNDEEQEQEKTTLVDEQLAMEEQKKDLQELTPTALAVDTSVATTISIIEGVASIDDKHQKDGECWEDPEEQEQRTYQLQSEETHEEQLASETDEKKEELQDLKPSVEDEADAATTEDKASIECIKQEDDAHLQEPEAVNVQQVQRSYELDNEETVSAHGEQLVDAVDTPKDPKEELEDIKLTVENDADAATTESHVEEPPSLHDRIQEEDIHLEDSESTFKEQEEKSYQLQSEDGKTAHEETLESVADDKNELQELKLAIDEDEIHLEVTEPSPTPQDFDVPSEESQNNEVEEEEKTTLADGQLATAVEEEKEELQELTRTVLEDDASTATAISPIEAEPSIDDSCVKADDYLEELKTVSEEPEQSTHELKSAETDKEQPATAKDEINDELHELKPAEEDEADAPTKEEEASTEDMKQQDDAHLQEPEAVTVEQELRSYQLESDKTTATSEEQLVHTVDTPHEPEEELQSEESHEEPLTSAMDEQKEELQELKFTVADDEADAARAEERASIDDIKQQDDAHLQEPEAKQEPRSYQLQSEETTPPDEEQLSNAMDTPNKPEEELEELKPTEVEGQVDAATTELLGEEQASLHGRIQEGDTHPEDPEVTPVEQEQRIYQLQGEESKPAYEEQLEREADAKKELHEKKPAIEESKPAHEEQLEREAEEKKELQEQTPAIEEAKTHLTVIESSLTPRDLDIPSELAQNDEVQEEEKNDVVDGQIASPVEEQKEDLQELKPLEDDASLTTTTLLVEAEGSIDKPKEQNEEVEEMKPTVVEYEDPAATTESLIEEQTSLHDRKQEDYAQLQHPEVTSVEQEQRSYQLQSEEYKPADEEQLEREADEKNKLQESKRTQREDETPATVKEHQEGHGEEQHPSTEDDVIPCSGAESSPICSDAIHQEDKALQLDGASVSPEEDAMQKKETRQDDEEQQHNPEERTILELASAMEEVRQASYRKEDGAESQLEEFPHYSEDTVQEPEVTNVPLVEDAVHKEEGADEIPGTLDPPPNSSADDCASSLQEWNVTDVPAGDPHEEYPEEAHIVQCLHEDEPHHEGREETSPTPEVNVVPYSDADEPKDDTQELEISSVPVHESGVEEVISYDQAHELEATNMTVIEELQEPEEATPEQKPRSFSLEVEEGKVADAVDDQKQELESVELQSKDNNLVDEQLASAVDEQKEGVVQAPYRQEDHAESQIDELPHYSENTVQEPQVTDVPLEEHVYKAKVTDELPGSLDQLSTTSADDCTNNLRELIVTDVAGKPHPETQEEAHPTPEVKAGDNLKMADTRPDDLQNEEVFEKYQGLEDQSDKIPADEGSDYLQKLEAIDVAQLETPEEARPASEDTVGRCIEEGAPEDNMVVPQTFSVQLNDIDNAFNLERGDGLQKQEEITEDHVQEPNAATMIVQEGLQELEEANSGQDPRSLHLEEKLINEEHLAKEMGEQKQELEMPEVLGHNEGRMVEADESVDQSLVGTTYQPQTEESIFANREPLNCTVDEKTEELEVLKPPAGDDAAAATTEDRGLTDNIKQEDANLKELEDATVEQEQSKDQLQSEEGKPDDEEHLVNAMDKPQEELEELTSTIVEDEPYAETEELLKKVDQASTDANKQADDAHLQDPEGQQVEQEQRGYDLQMEESNQIENEEGEPASEEQIANAMDEPKEKPEELGSTIVEEEPYAKTTELLKEEDQASTDDKKQEDDAHLQEPEGQLTAQEQRDYELQMEESSLTDKEPLKNALEEQTREIEVLMPVTPKDKAHVADTNLLLEDQASSVTTTQEDDTHQHEPEVALVKEQQTTYRLPSEESKFATEEPLNSAVDEQREELKELQITVADDVSAAATTEEKVSSKDTKQNDNAHLQTPEEPTVEQEQRSYQLQSQESTPADEEQLVNAMDKPLEELEVSVEDDASAEATTDNKALTADTKQKHDAHPLKPQALEEQTKELELTHAVPAPTDLLLQDQASIDNATQEDDAHLQELEQTAYQLQSEENKIVDELLNSEVDGQKEELEELRPAAEDDAATVTTAEDKELTKQNYEAHLQPQEETVEQEQRSYQFQSEESTPADEGQLVNAVDKPPEELEELKFPVAEHEPHVATTEMLIEEQSLENSKQEHNAHLQEPEGPLGEQGQRSYEEENSRADEEQLTNALQEQIKELEEMMDIPEDEANVAATELLVGAQASIDNKTQEDDNHLQEPEAATEEQEQRTYQLHGEERNAVKDEQLVLAVDKPKEGLQEFKSSVAEDEPNSAATELLIEDQEPAEKEQLTNALEGQTRELEGLKPLADAVNVADADLSIKDQATADDKTLESDAHLQEPEATPSGQEQTTFQLQSEESNSAYDDERKPGDEVVNALGKPKEESEDPKATLAEDEPYEAITEPLNEEEASHHDRKQEDEAHPQDPDATPMEEDQRSYPLQNEETKPADEEQLATNDEKQKEEPEELKPTIVEDETDAKYVAEELHQEDRAEEIQPSTEYKSDDAKQEDDAHLPQLEEVAVKQEQRSYQFPNEESKTAEEQLADAENEVDAYDRKEENDAQLQKPEASSSLERSYQLETEESKPAHEEQIAREVDEKKEIEKLKPLIEENEIDTKLNGIAEEQLQGLTEENGTDSKVNDIAEEQSKGQPEELHSSPETKILQCVDVESSLSSDNQIGTCSEAIDEEDKDLQLDLVSTPLNDMNQAPQLEKGLDMGTIQEGLQNDDVENSTYHIQSEESNSANEEQSTIAEKDEELKEMKLITVDEADTPITGSSLKEQASIEDSKQDSEISDLGASNVPYRPENTEQTPDVTQVTVGEGNEKKETVPETHVTEVDDLRTPANEHKYEDKFEEADAPSDIPVTGSLIDEHKSTNHNKKDNFEHKLEEEDVLSLEEENTPEPDIKDAERVEEKLPEQPTQLMQESNTAQADEHNDDTRELTVMESREEGHGQKTHADTEATGPQSEEEASMPYDKQESEAQTLDTTEFPCHSDETIQVLDTQDILTEEEEKIPEEQGQVNIKGPKDDLSEPVVHVAEKPQQEAPEESTPTADKDDAQCSDAGNREDDKHQLELASVPINNIENTGLDHHKDDHAQEQDVDDSEDGELDHVEQEQWRYQLQGEESKPADALLVSAVDEQKQELQKVRPTLKTDVITDSLIEDQASINLRKQEYAGHLLEPKLQAPMVEQEQQSYQLQSEENNPTIKEQLVSCVDEQKSKPELSQSQTPSDFPVKTIASINDTEQEDDAHLQKPSSTHEAGIKDLPAPM